MALLLFSLPSQVSKRESERKLLGEIIEWIFKRDRRVRFVAIYQDQYLLAGGMREGVTSLDPEEEAREIDLKLAKIAETIGDWQKWFGKLETFLLRYEKVSLIFQPLSNNRFLIISCEPDLDLFPLLKELKGNKRYENLSKLIP